MLVGSYVPFSDGKLKHSEVICSLQRVRVRWWQMWGLLIPWTFALTGSATPGLPLGPISRFSNRHPWLGAPKLHVLQEGLGPPWGLL